MMEHYSTAAEIDGWEDASNVEGGFYLSPQWLKSADDDLVSEPAYFRMSAEGPVGFLAANYSPNENNGFYHPGLILGGRRGYLSRILGTPTDSGLRQLVDAACNHFNADDYTWPFLPTSDTLHAFAALGGTVSFAGAHCVLDVERCKSFEEFIASFNSQQRRTNARRELRRFDDSGLLLERGILGQRPASPELLGPLLGEVQRGYGHNHSDQTLVDLLQRQRDSLGDSSVVFLASDSEGPAAFSLCYTHGDSLYGRLVGFDRSRTENVGAYGKLAIYEPAAYAIEHQLKTVYLGMESFEAKVRRGARVEPLWTISPKPVKAADLPRILSELPDREAKQLREECEAVRTSVGAAL